MLYKTVLMLAAISGFLTVALGAFGAHGLETVLTPERLNTWHTGVLYQMFHTLALLALGLLLMQVNSAWLHWSAWLFLAGIILFSGSLYVLALSGIRILGAITPLGGLAFLAGWVCLLVGVWKAQA